MNAALIVAGCALAPAAVFGLIVAASAAVDRFRHRTTIDLTVLTVDPATSTVEDTLTRIDALHARIDQAYRDGYRTGREHASPVGVPWEQFVAEHPHIAGGRS